MMMTFLVEILNGTDTPGGGDRPEALFIRKKG
jgi:hypothetical protein